MLIILTAILGLVLQGVFIWQENKKHFVAAVILKGSASLMFVLLGFYFYNRMVAQSTPEFSRLIVIGLCFGMAGDIMLNLRWLFKEAINKKVFLVGVAVFLTGHVFYLICTLKRLASPWLGLLGGAVVAAAILAVIFKKLELNTTYKIFGIVYIGLVCLMTGCAVASFIATNAGGAYIFALGAVLFTASDVILIFNTFGPKQKLSLRIANLYLYYIGQLAIAFSIAFVPIV